MTPPDIREQVEIHMRDVIRDCVCLSIVAAMFVISAVGAIVILGVI